MATADALLGHRMQINRLVKEDKTVWRFVAPAALYHKLKA